MSTRCYFASGVMCNSVRWCLRTSALRVLLPSRPLFALISFLIVRIYSLHSWMLAFALLDSIWSRSTWYICFSSFISLFGLFSSLNFLRIIASFSLREAHSRLLQANLFLEITFLSDGCALSVLICVVR